MQWTASAEILDGRSTRYRLVENGQPISFANWLASMQRDANFRVYFNELLAGSRYLAFRWESPGITLAAMDRPFEFVLLDSPGLERKPEPGAFANQFSMADENDLAIEFTNLGGDAILIVPRPQEPSDEYCHLAAFVRNASQSQLHALWSLVASAMQRRLDARPAWLSTAGAGVAWLHVRIDDRPKYYGFAPYRQSPA